jgi:gentisate 1,2-dioxygenase
MVVTELADGSHSGDLTEEARYYDYASTANPLFAGLIPPVPYQSFSPEFFERTTSGILPLDVSEEMKLPGPATSPALLANFVRIVNGSVTTTALATSQLFFVFQGSGRTEACGRIIEWSEGDFIVLPAHGHAVHHTEGEAGMYWVHDAPLLRYLGVTATEERFKPTVFQHSKAEAKLEQIVSDPVAGHANRVSVLLANSNFPQTRTITHTLWAMFGLLPKDAVQYPHRHESVALDFVISCKPGCYTMIGTELGPDGMISNGHREDWKPGASFITPAGYWHSHHNESGEDAHVLPIQDAGLHTYLRTLDILYSHPDHDRTSHISQKP